MEAAEPLTVMMSMTPSRLRSAATAHAAVALTWSVTGFVKPPLPFPARQESEEAE